MVMTDSMFSVLQHRILDSKLVAPVEMAVGVVPYGANRYIKGHTLGEGTYGVVFKAIDKVVTTSCFLWNV